MSFMILYIDPGTGSMLFTVLISIIGFLLFIAKTLWIKLRFILTGGRASSKNADKIPYLIFAEDKRYLQIFKPICDEFEKRGIDVEYWTGSPDDKIMESGYKHIKPRFIGEGNKAYAKMNTANACVVLSTTPGLDVYQWRRSKSADYYVHMFHSVGYGGYRMFGIDFYDAMIAAGQYQIDILRVLEEKRGLPAKDAALVGMPYFDELKKKLDAAKPVHKDMTTVLLAPSWGENSIFSKLGTSIIDELLKTEYDIIIRPHPQSFINDAAGMEQIMKDYPASDRLTWDRSPDNFDTLNKADILISDFSGVIFDFAFVFDKPVIYASNSDFDINCRDYYWLDKKYYWIFNSLPDIGTEINKDNIGEINSIIEESLNNTSGSSKRDAKRQEAWANQGTGAAATVDYLVNKYQEITAS